MNMHINFKDRKTQIAIGVIILAIVALFVIRHRLKACNKKGGSVSSDNAGSDSNTTTGLAEASFPLRPYNMAGVYSAEKGSRGTQIRYLQKVLNDSGYEPRLEEDGKYGPKTLEAFKSEFADEYVGKDGSISKSQYTGIVSKYYVK